MLNSHHRNMLTKPTEYEHILHKPQVATLISHRSLFYNIHHHFLCFRLEIKTDASKDKFAKMLVVEFLFYRFSNLLTSAQLHLDRGIIDSSGDDTGRGTNSLRSHSFTISTVQGQ